MSPREILSEVLVALDKGNYDKVLSLLSGDFKFSGPVPEPVGANEFVAFERALRAALPNLRHNGKVYSEAEGEWVRGEVRVTGTHKSVLDMPAIPPVEATGKKIKLPTERWVALVRDGKIISFAAEVGPDGGLIGILKQIGRADLADCLLAKGSDCRTYGEQAATEAHY